jgi:NAD(P)-dependent dehydrogenase (short-subunit alcohol dehydrogenase family)
VEFSGKVVLVTGGGSGVGEATAKILAAGGAKVGILDLRADRVDAVTAAIRAAGGDVVALPPTDVADEAQMRTAIDALMAEAGRLDAVIANAGINGVWAPIDDLTPAEWDKTIAVNLRGIYLTLHLTVPHLKAAGGGSIVIVASINGTRTFSSAGATAYAATKAGQAAMANQLALELGKHRIRVNTVAPGSTKTNLFENTWRRNTDAARVPATFPEGDMPLTGGIPAKPEDIADAIVMLVSDRSRHVTGTWLFVDGGQSLLR